MSAKQTGLVWELQLPHNEARVLMAMADHADQEGNNVYPGVPLLAWRTGYTTRQVRRILAILQEKGLIIVEEEGGGRRTTRYRLDLARADRKDLRPAYARSTLAEAVQVSEPREDKMSPRLSSASGAPMSRQPGQNVRAARTQLCQPNRHGREGKEPSIPPPSDSSHHQRPLTVADPPPNGENGENGEGGGKPGENERGDGETPRARPSPVEIIWRAWAGRTGRKELPAERRQSFDRQAERLASGHDLEAWTHPVNGAVVPSDDRRRIFKLGLQHLEGMIRRTLQGGVM